MTAAPRAAGWLGLAAAPTFAVMALLTAAFGAGAAMMCPPAQGAPPLSGMVPMYVLMSAFHSTPWLRRLSRRLSRSAAAVPLASGAGRASRILEGSP
jgi:hypothetical protein